MFYLAVEEQPAEELPRLLQASLQIHGACGEKKKRARGSMMSKGKEGVCLLGSKPAVPRWFPPS